MSTYELAKRMDVSPTRIRQFESAEVAGSIRLSSMRRVAHGLDCRLLYVFVPNEPLEEMVHAQAQRKAAARLSISNPEVLENEARELPELRLLQMYEDLAMEWVDRRGLWS